MNCDNMFLKRIKLAVLIIFILLIAYMIGHSQNRTPGDCIGTDDVAFAFAPHMNEHGFVDRGEMDYKDHVCDENPYIGQNYDFADYCEPNAPSTSPPTIGNLVNFYNIIASSTDELGVLLITTHGTINYISVEAYEKTASGLAARNARFSEYINGTADPSVPPLSYGEIASGWTKYTYGIGVYDALVANRGDLTKGLVYVSACTSVTVTDGFVDGNARVAVGNLDGPFSYEVKDRVRTFFSRMNGRSINGQSDRTVWAAMSGMPLGHTGDSNTTLSPSVIEVIANAPLEVGDSVVVKMETNCDTTNQPDIYGLHCVIENEYWLDSLTMVGFCTETPYPKAYTFGIDLDWSEIFSANNYSALDGNTDPIGPEIYNAKGPSLDNYTQLFVDSSDWKYFINLTGYRPENNPIWTEWQKIYPDTFETWEIDIWYDDGDNVLGPEDSIEIFEQSSQKTLTELVDLVTPFIKVTIYKSEVYLEMIENNPLITDWPFPIGTYWVEISPDYTKAYQIIGWTDYDGSGDLNYFDYINLYVLNGPDSGQSHACQVEKYMTGILTSLVCQGECGDANGDGDVTVADAVYVYNYVFIGGPQPLPVFACGDANNDGTVNISDGVYIINYVFVGGDPPEDCSPGSPNWIDGDCCPFTP